MQMIKDEFSRCRVKEYILLRHNLSRLRFRDGEETYHTFEERAKRLLYDIKDTNIAFNEDLEGFIALYAALPERFEVTKVMWWIRPAIPSIAAAFQDAKVADQLHRGGPNYHGLHIPGDIDGTSHTKRRNAKSKPRLTCSHCRIRGHLSKECWRLHPELRRQ